MKMTAMALSIFVSTMSLLASAAPGPKERKALLEAQPTCGNFVRFDDRAVFIGFGPYRNAFEEPRSPIPGSLRIASFDGSEPFELPTDDAAIDVVTEGSTAFVLTYSSIEEWDLTSRRRVATYGTYAINGTLEYQQHAQAWARYGNKMIIAHGRLGVSIFDLSKRRLTNQFRLLRNQLPLESMATGVTVQGDRAYVLMDNFHVTSPGDGVQIFRGLIVVDLKTERVEKEMAGLDPGADSIVSDGRKVIVSFGGNPVWKYSLSSLAGTSMPQPELRIWKFPVDGHPTGAAAMDDLYYYTCYSHPGPDGRYVRTPLALDRRVIMLD